MTTWYTAQGPDGLVRAYSVRPDLWPPGLLVDVMPSLARGWLANWASSSWGATPWPVDLTGAEGPLDQYVAPGAAEALVLAGRVEISTEFDRTDLAWVLAPGGPLEIAGPLDR